MRVAVAVSGGRDSTALLHCTLHEAVRIGLHVCALHVHHGLQPTADAWVVHVRRQVQRWAARGLPVSFHVHRIDGTPSPGDSVEAWARDARYRALASMARLAGCDAVLLAHHRRDQAETVLLQALRGAGPAGLSAMPIRAVRDGIHWLRPWLQMPREAIEAYVRRHRLGFVDDGSNTDTRFARNRLRADVWPVLGQAFPAAETSLCHVARRAQEARACLEELASLDLQACSHESALEVAKWLQLSAERRANAMRAWLTRHGTRPDDALVQRLLDQLPACTVARWPATDGQLELYRGRLRFVADVGGPARPARDPRPQPLKLDLSRPGRIELPPWGGVLVVEPVAQGGLPAALLRAAECRPRIGGERFQLGAGRPPRALKKQYQALGVPASQRSGPLVYTAAGLAFVPGLGIDGRVAGDGAGPALTLRWEPGVSLS